ncbi:15039_t:CDS:10 [Acaulospora colombiana]|uniref:15039_t:CDS:1 n=1 Tax=Acaulospora colombiana TaxID=27376 RepID=A0ACA9LU92_9GLOM|nr:15039_t:CDS:10 [Acaulospora colombiana]
MSEPDRIVGELLQPGGVAALGELGLINCLENIDSIPCHGYGVFYNDEVVHIPYPKTEGGTPHRGRSFHHGRFIMNLRRAVSKVPRRCWPDNPSSTVHPSVTIYEATANEIIRCPITEHVLGVICSPKDNRETFRRFFAPLTIVVDGCFSKFRKDFIPREVQVKSNFVGFVMKDCVLPYKHHGHVVLGKTAPILMYQIGSNETRVLIDIPGKLPSNGTGALKKYIEMEILPAIPKSVQQSFYEAIQRERLRSMPNSFLPPSTNTTEGLIMLGDAMNMRHPLTGGSDTKLILMKMHTFHWKRKFNSSTVVNVLAQALYALFAANVSDTDYLDQNLCVLREACFEYFKLGGICIDHPCGMLAGVFTNPFLLITHFFAVAALGIWRLFVNGKMVQIPENIVKSFMVFYTACVVILPYLWWETKS